MFLNIRINLTKIANFNFYNFFYNYFKFFQKYLLYFNNIIHLIYIFFCLKKLINFKIFIKNYYQKFIKTLKYKAFQKHKKVTLNFFFIQL